jgi:hypothetical protein
MFCRAVNMVLATGLLLSGTPHLLCPCAMAAPATQPVAKPVCPHCQHQSAPKHDPGKQSCDCGACEVMQAVSPGGAVHVAPPAHWSVLHVALYTLLPAVARCHPLPEGWAVEPPGSPHGSGRALTIFLGHLLF